MHPNIVTLEEVLQNSKYIGIVLQYASGGEFYKYIQKKRRLKEPAACRLFAQLISGVHYMHHKCLAHRDLKLENLLLDEHENLIITDFGFVNEFGSNNDLMKTSCGSPCYAAPELVVTTKAYEARKADVWSCGVILYAMLAGYLPWDDDPENPDGDDIAKLYNYITKTPLKFPEYINPVPRDILRRILISDPAKRITVEKIEKHQWLSAHALFLALKPEDWDIKAKAEINNILRPPQTAQPRYTRPHSNSSVSSSEKRNSLIMDSTLHPQPVPPQESQSHAIAKPSSPSSELRSSPIKRKNHSRSNSAASIALQAVVDAEREFFQTNQANFQQSLPTNTEQAPVRIQTYSSSRSTTHNTASSLMNRNSIIVEVSPSKETFSSSATVIPALGFSNSRDSYVSNSPSRLQKQSPKFVHGAFSSNTSHPNNGKFSSSQQSRPRPTSYHPISSSYIEVHSPKLQNITVASNSEFSYSARSIAANSETSDLTESPEITSKVVELPGSSQNTHNYQKSIVRSGSFSAVKPSPSVDLNNVEGDLIKSDEDEHSHLKQRPRKSHRYSTIAVETLIGTVNEETDDLTTGTIVPNLSNQSVNNLSKELERIVIDEAQKSTLEKVDDRAEQQKRPVERSDSRKKEKRFSLLSFYSYYNNSKTSLESESAASARKISSNSQRPAEKDRSPKMNISAKDRSISGSTNNSDSSKTRVPSNASIRNNYRHSMLPPKSTPTIDPNNSGQKRSHRSSVMVSSLKNSTDSTNSHKDQRDQREPSTAKKVFDFFKRRSMRL